MLAPGIMAARHVRMLLDDFAGCICKPWIARCCQHLNGGAEAAESSQQNRAVHSLYHLKAYRKNAGGNQTRTQREKMPIRC